METSRVPNGINLSFDRFTGQTPPEERPNRKYYNDVNGFPAINVIQTFYFRVGRLRLMVTLIPDK